MRTIHWIVGKYADNLSTYPQIIEAAQLLHNNEVIAFPTETVYGLGANALSDDAIAKIFTAKGRPADNPLIVHIATISQLDELTEHVTEKASLLIQAFWPGPLTIIFPKKAYTVSDLVTAGMETVAVRMPDHPISLALIAAAGVPIAAPSANQSGKPSPTTAQHVVKDLNGRIAGIIDGGMTGVGVESTVIDCSGEVPVILRPGGVAKEAIEKIIGEVVLDPALADSDEKPKSPGMKYTHYATAAPLYLVDGEQEWLQGLIDEKRALGQKVGVLATNETASAYDADFVLPCGSKRDLKTVAHHLYDTLRTFDEMQPDIIFAEVFPTVGIGAALMNRLEKAAGHKWFIQNQS